MPQVPSSVEAEQALLGSMLLYPDTIKLAFEENLKVNDFFVDANKKIYQVIDSLNEENKPVDITTVITRLTDLQQLNNVGGADYIAHLTDLAISSTNCQYYITTLKEKALLRKLIEVSEDIKKKSYEDQYDPLDVLNEAETKIVEISRNRKTTEFVSAKEAFNQAIQQLNYISQHTGMTGVPTGYEYLDNFTNGFQKGDMVIIAARPSVGKTAFALNLACNAAIKYDKSVAIFSLEMPVVQLANRMLSSQSMVNSDKIRKGQGLTNDDWASIDEAKSKLERSKIYIDDTSSIKVNDIFAKCRKLQADKGLDMVVIDYLGLITPSSERSESREREVSVISRSLKMMARELNVPVLALSQLSRANAKEKREPVMSDLRDSGSIEQDADIVLILHKAHVDEDADGKEISCDLKVKVDKNRNGSTGYLFLKFEKSTSALYTMDPSSAQYLDGDGE